MAATAIFVFRLAWNLSYQVYSGFQREDWLQHNAGFFPFIVCTQLPIERNPGSCVVTTDFRTMEQAAAGKNVDLGNLTADVF